MLAFRPALRAGTGRACRRVVSINRRYIMVISPSEYIKKCLKIDFDNSVENIIDTGASIIIL